MQDIASPTRTRIFTLFLIVLSILGVALVFINTATYGPGISSDGMDYLSTADSLIRGQGFTNFHGGVYILWPPLYPLVLAGLHVLTGLDPFVVGWILNALALGVTIFLAGILLQLCFPDRLAWPALGALLTLFFLSYLVSASNIASDPLFIVLVLAFFLACHHYLTTSGRQALWLMLALDWPCRFLTARHWECLPADQCRNLAPGDWRFPGGRTAQGFYASGRLGEAVRFHRIQG